MASIDINTFTKQEALNRSIPYYTDAKAVAVNTDVTECRAVYIGTTQSVDLKINGSWYEFQGATAGDIIPVAAVAARKNSGGDAPDAGDIVFLY